MNPSDLLTEHMLSWQALWLIGFPIFILGAGVVELVKRWRRRRRMSES